MHANVEKHRIHRQNASGADDERWSSLQWSFCESDFMIRISCRIICSVQQIKHNEKSIVWRLQIYEVYVRVPHVCCTRWVNLWRFPMIQLNPQCTLVGIHLSIISTVNVSGCLREHLTLSEIGWDPLRFSWKGWALLAHLEWLPFLINCSQPRRSNTEEVHLTMPGR